MVHLPMGKGTAHVEESSGANNNIMNFYITEYSSKLGTEGFSPRLGKHNGTGYQSNFRPGVYYSRRLDEHDNPVIGRILNENYISTTCKSHQGWKASVGTDPFVKDTTIRPSGFITNDKRTLPTYNQVYAAPRSAPASLASKRLGNIARENVPYLSENHSQFSQKNPHVNAAGKSLGAKEMSGFTHEKNLEPIMFHPEECFDGSMFTWRPTGVSMTNTSYLPLQVSQGKEKLPSIPQKAERDNGFTRFIRPTVALTGSDSDAYTQHGDLKPVLQKKVMKQDPCEYLNLMHAAPYPSMKQAVFQGKQLHDDPTLTEKMRNITVGEKEDTGYSSNNKGYTRLPDDISQFSTVYQKQYYDKNNILKSRHERRYKDGVFPPSNDGYTKNEKMHNLGKDTDIERELQTVHPYVTKSLKARDPFYAEQMYTHKKKVLQAC